MFKYILIIFLATRLINLTLLPIFVDEANYLDWGWRETHTKKFLFYSLYDAKPPGIMWLFGLSQSLITDPLLAGRLVIILFGLLTLIGLYKISPPATILYTLSPIFLFFDRQALMETPLSTIGVWSYYFLTKKKPIISGLIIGFGMLIKTNAILFLIPTLILSGSVVNAILALTAFLISGSPLFFQPQFWSTLGTNSRFSLSIAELIRFPISIWFKNLWAYLQISFWHFTPPIFIATTIGLRKINKSQLVYIFIPIIILIFTSRSPGIRYLIPFLPLLFIPASNFISKHIKLRSLSFASCFLVIGILIFNPPYYFRLLNYVTPYSQISEYLTGRNTGYQVNSTLKYLSTLHPPLLIGVALNSGNPEAALINHFHSSKEIQVIYFDSQIVKLPPEYDCLSMSAPFYFVARKDEQAGLEKYFTKITTITNSYSDDFNNIYTLRSNCVPGKTLNLR